MRKCLLEGSFLPRRVNVSAAQMLSGSLASHVHVQIKGANARLQFAPEYGKMWPSLEGGEKGRMIVVARYVDDLRWGAGSMLSSLQMKKKTKANADSLCSECFQEPI